MTAHPTAPAPGDATASSPPEKASPDRPCPWLRNHSDRHGPSRPHGLESASGLRMLNGRTVNPSKSDSVKSGRTAPGRRASGSPVPARSGGASPAGGRRTLERWRRARRLGGRTARATSHPAPPSDAASPCRLSRTLCARRKSTRAWADRGGVEMPTRIHSHRFGGDHGHWTAEVPRRRDQGRVITRRRRIRRSGPRRRRDRVPGLAGAHVPALTWADGGPVRVGSADGDRRIMTVDLLPDLRRCRRFPPARIPRRAAARTGHAPMNKPR